MTTPTAPRRARPPGPRLPMLGSLIMPGRDPLAIFTRFARDYGDLTFFRMSGERVFFLNHPDYIRQVLVTEHAKFAKSRALERARRLLGDGLLTCDGAEHQRRRRLVQPAFHRAEIAAYAATMVEHARRLDRRWQDGTTVDVCERHDAADARHRRPHPVRRRHRRRARTWSATALTDVLETFWLTLLPFSQVVEALPLRALKRAARARAQARRV